MALEDLFGSPDYLRQLLGEEQFNKARQNALSQGVINASLQLLAGTPPSFDNRNATQRLIAQAGQAGLQGYQGSMDRTLSDMAKSMQIQDMLEKQKRDKRFREQIGAAYTTRPSGTGLTSTGQGSQAQMLAEQIKEFGDEGMASTVGALQSNVNLPQERVLDQRKFMSALAEYNPLEYAKMTMTGEKAPEQVRTFEAFSKMNPEQQKQFLTFRASGQPQQNVSLGEKGVDKVIGERIGEFSSSAASARRFAQDAQTINTILKGKGGGEVVKIGTQLAKDLGFANESVTAQDLANSIAVRGATTMRAPGSGSTSDIEFRAYTSAFPSLSNSEAGRNFMADASGKFATRSAKLSDYAMRLYKDGKYSEEAIAEYDRQLGSVLDLNELDKLIKSSPAPKSGNRRSF
jgi:hypothetical protein